MRQLLGSFALGLVAALHAGAASAQLDNMDAPVVVGHFDLNVSSVEAQMRFWVDTLGGTRLRVGPGDVPAVRFPGTVLLLHERPPTGPTLGTTFDHIGFAVPDVPAMTERVVTNGYKLTVGREPAPGETASPPTAGNYGQFSYLLGPDGVKVELVTNSEPDAKPIEYHHVHFVNDEFVAMEQWYEKAFDATLRPGQTDFFIGADLPGVGYSLNFFSWLPDQKLVGTRGRVVGRVGFEVRDLEAFCAGLEHDKGIELTKPYGFEPELGIYTAEIVDPWGTVLELTEGLRERL